MQASKFQKLLGLTALVLSGSLSAAPLMLGPTNENSAGLVTLATAETGDLYVRFDLAFSGSLSSDDFAALWFDDSSTGSHSSGAAFGLKVNGGSSGADFFARTSGSGGVFDTSAPLQMTTSSSVNLFAHLYKTGTSTKYNRIDLWIGSTLSSLDLLSTTAHVFATGDSGLSSVSYLGFRNRDLDTNGSSPDDRVTISNFSYASSLSEPSSLSDTNAVPEPSTWALMAMSLIGMAVVMRRRQS